jgi:hypothetical protein
MSCKEDTMGFFGFGSAGRRLPVASLFTALIGLAPLLWPGAAAAQGTCGRVYLVNTQNELLLLARAADFYESISERPVSTPRAIIRARQAIAGLAPGEVLVGIDFRPSTGVLYGIGRIGSDATGQLYTIDVTSGAATAVRMRAVPLNGAAFGVDFNPVPDLIRIVSDTGQNVRLNPVTAAVAPPGPDTNLTYPAAGDPNAGRVPGVVAVAYLNPDRSLNTNTLLYDIDADRAADPGAVAGDVLAAQVPPNGGVLNTLGRLGVDATDFVSFDIGPNNEALAAIQPVGSPFSRLYVIDLTSGVAIDIGQIGTGELVAGLAIEVGPQCDPAP